MPALESRAVDGGDDGIPGAFGEDDLDFLAGRPGRDYPEVPFAVRVTTLIAADPANRRSATDR